MKNLNFLKRFKKSSKPNTLEKTKATEPVSRGWMGKITNASIGKSTIEVIVRNIKLQKHSFSRMKKNVFKFGLELTLITFVLVSVGINATDGSYEFKSGQNKFLAFLSDHPDLNSNIIKKLQTENVRVAPEKLHFVMAAQAATLDSMIGISIPTTTDPQKFTDESTQMFSEDSVIVKPNYATKDATQRRDIREYTVQNGDSISAIASEFGVSILTILHENNLSEQDYIKPGQVLNVLPTTGIKHTIKKGENLGSIAKKYEVPLEAILEFNEIQIPDDIQEGEVIIIPEGKIEIPSSRQSEIASYSKIDIKTASAPADFQGTSGSLIWPLPTRNVTQYYWSRHLALDISNGKRPQFWAAQDGIVEISGWQGAYGNTIVVNHGNGLKTRYAHASELYVTAGDKVSKGQVIGRVGNTGRTYGATGNHLHFEVIRNGVKQNPLSYIQ
ncbi:MAG: hypothetical protein COT91_00085 [Candidatus Doudnabacteria bacterium CG10_big_fil_rev_8_21_14_0_10_41_10]|uniref:LysM domain-containing protein n=1 Tax=Candidatus Doudnabacteria bacterium CG10_big_fil_rev_8_21_14_0_10_41_10 TaxID=1974551 RepID=A0A2H0VH52_9BACT|nr:MAG: hypothetical protein COT91_00085 [Candidatus Doudnabacteria bacterium CG10_big_fil_rev_8_21_14_0_10_41_10]